MAKETQEELEEKIKNQLKQETLASYDVRNHVFQAVKEDVILRRESNKQTRFRYDYGIYQKTKNVLIRTAIGKKWAPLDHYDDHYGYHVGYNYDYDASLISSIIMRDIILPGGGFELLPNAWCEYKICCKEGETCIEYRGDTMNSWSTTLNRYLRRFGGEDDPSLSDLESELQSELKLDIDPLYKKIMPPDITEFLRVVYTIGNFIPWPCGCNGPRGIGPTKDYWDLTLYQIYQWYRKNDMLHRDRKKLPLHNNANLVALFGSQMPNFSNWLISFGSWDNFVNKTYMQPFVNGGGTKFSYESKAEEKRKEGYGAPKELWEGHFKQWEKHLEDSDYGVYPSTEEEEEEFHSFFTNAAACIKARGEKIEKGLNKLYYNKEDA